MFASSASADPQHAAAGFTIVSGQADATAFVSLGSNRRHGEWLPPWVITFSPALGMDRRALRN
jgi:hypothetical protein